VTVEGEELGAIARRVVDSNQFITIGTADEEGVLWVSPAWYASAEYREFSRCPIRRRGTRATSPPGRRSRS
jgi:hypothetical protein